VVKRPLEAACVELDYDITRAQPQLFVARDFEQLDDVLEAVAGTLAQRTGGLRGLHTALAAEESATLTLDSGVQLAGQVSAVDGGAGTTVLVQLAAPCTLVEGGRALGELSHAEPALLWLGVPPQGSTDAAGRFELRSPEGAVISGTVLDRVDRSGRLLAVRLQHAELRAPDGRLTRYAGPLLLVAAAAVTAASAGAPDGLEPPTEPSGQRVPKPRDFDAAQRELSTLYERGLWAFRSLGGKPLVRACAELVARLEAAYPDEWLLRFNLLESLVKAGEAGALAGKLEADLERLELRFGGREPIATGLAYLRALAAGTPSPTGGDARPSA
jgi:phenylalanine-4-hydroxylase